jgi:DNA topoisomerase-1
MRCVDAMNTLIVAEKPSVALRIAIALGNGSQKKVTGSGRVSYYRIAGQDGSETYVASAVGHLFTIRQRGAERGYPVLDVEWAPSYEVNRMAGYTRAYMDVLRELASRCQSLINACDYDTEGTVIGTNIIRFVGAKGADSKRMKFSTTTSRDLVTAYQNLMPMDMDNFYAGEARHILDWIWGINLSRALMSAVQGAGPSRPLSIGRVQGPTLALLARREREIGTFVPKPFWSVSVTVDGKEFANVRGDTFEKEVADAAASATRAAAGQGTVEKVERTERHVPPWPPFDLTSLQLEASRVFGMDPSRTLALAQSLYERSYISYPRTTSQKLPYTLGLRRIIEELGKNEEYRQLAQKLIDSGRSRPHEGSKVDEAHPAIFPTGVAPKALVQEEAKLYDLIARRFLACFADFASMDDTGITLRFGEERYAAKGSRVVSRGWLDFYKYTTPKEADMPKLDEGQRVSASDITVKESQTQPPKRYNKASLIAELERLGLGTKATRAAIVDTLFRRGYIDGRAITVTSFGMSVYMALKENCGMILDESTTRKLEEDMERIAAGKKAEAEVIAEGKDMLMQAIEQFDKNKDKVAQSMAIGMKRSEVVLGKCKADGGDLVIRHSRLGKQFVSCANYPKCTTSYSLPQHAKVIPTGKLCELCGTPKIKVFRRGGGVFEMCLDPNCETKKNWGKPKEASAGEATTGATAPTKKRRAATAKKEGGAEPAAATTADAVKKRKAGTKRATKKAKQAKKTAKRRTARQVDVAADAEQAGQGE